MSEFKDTLFEIKAFKEFLPEPLSLRLKTPHLAMIYGDSGAGKTRLLRVLADLDVNQADVLLDGQNRNSFTPSEWRQQVAYVPAETGWWGDVVEQHFYRACPLSWLQQLGFDEDVMQWQVNRLSSGERQRLGLLRALVLYPRVLLLDEISANLDVENTRKVELLVKDFLGRQNAVALWVSHDAEQRRRLASLQLHLKRDRVEVRI